MFQIRYALGGGFGGCENQEWEDCPCAKTKDQAETYAYEGACDQYEGYDGMYGLRSVEMIMEDDDLNEEEAEEEWREERESWLDYEVREV